MKAIYKFELGQHILVVEAENENDSVCLKSFKEEKTRIAERLCVDPNYRFEILMLAKTI